MVSQLWCTVTDDPGPSLHVWIPISSTFTSAKVQWQPKYSTFNRENNLHKIVHTEISAHYLEFIYLLSHEVNKETQHQAGFSDKSGKKKKY